MTSREGNLETIVFNKDVGRDIVPIDNTREETLGKDDQGDAAVQVAKI